MAFAASAGRTMLVMFLMTSTTFYIESLIRKRRVVCSGLYLKLHGNSSPESSFFPFQNSFRCHPSLMIAKVV
jgi:hypothetical protein